jgi:hypothetical protein
MRKGLKEAGPFPLLDNYPTVRIVRAVLKTLVPVSELEHLEWEVHVVKASCELLNPFPDI